VAERYNRTLLDRARTLLADASLPPRFWGEAVTHSAAILNAVCRARATVSPASALLGVAPDLSAFHAFGSEVWIHDDAPPAGKLGARGLRGSYLGGEGPLNSGSYRVLVSDRIVTSCDITFLDSRTSHFSGPSPAAPGGELLADEGAPADESADPLGEAVVLTRAEDPPLHPPHGAAALPGLPTSLSAARSRQVRFNLPDEVPHPADSPSARIPCSGGLLLDGDGDVPDVEPVADAHDEPPSPLAQPAPLSYSGPLPRSRASAASAATSPTPDMLPHPRSVSEVLAGSESAE
jgi:hypothetical protein